MTKEELPEKIQLTEDQKEILQRGNPEEIKAEIKRLEKLEADLLQRVLEVSSFRSTLESLREQDERQQSD